MLTDDPDGSIQMAGMITVSEAARILGRSIEQVRRYLREGKLKGQRIGQQWFIERASLGFSYTPSKRGRMTYIAEPAAVMEPARGVLRAGKMNNEEIKAVMERIKNNRERIRERLGANNTIDVVGALSRDREER